MKVSDLIVEVVAKYSEEQAIVIEEMLKEYKKNIEKYGIKREDIQGLFAMCALLVDIQAEILSVTEKDNG